MLRVYAWTDVLNVRIYHCLDWHYFRRVAGLVPADAVTPRFHLRALRPEPRSDSSIPDRRSFLRAGISFILRVLPRCAYGALFRVCPLPPSFAPSPACVNGCSLL